MAWVLLVQDMNSHLNIGLSGLSGKAIKLPQYNSPHSSASLFQQFLDKNGSDKIPAEKLTPDTIRTLASNLMMALDRASMHGLFSDADAKPETGLESLLSTNLFMALRNSAMAPMRPEQASVVNHHITAPISKAVNISETTHPDINTEKAIAPHTKSSRSTNEQYASIIQRAAAANDLDPTLIEAVVRTESDFNAQAVSPVGAQGLMQLMPATAADLGVTDAFDPEQNIQAGSKYLKRLMDRYNGNTSLALAAYNWGMGNMERNPDRMPQETVNYVAKITGLMHRAV